MRGQDVVRCIFYSELSYETLIDKDFFYVVNSDTVHLT